MKMPNIYHTIFLLLLLGCAASKVKSLQTDNSDRTIHFQQSSTYHQQVTTATPIKYKLFTGGLWTVLTVFWGSFAHKCYDCFTNPTSKFPETLFLATTDVLFVALGNLLLALCWVSLLSILVGKKEEVRQLFHKNRVAPSKVVSQGTADNPQSIGFQPLVNDPNAHDGDKPTYRSNSVPEEIVNHSSENNHNLPKDAPPAQEDKNNPADFIDFS